MQDSKMQNNIFWIIAVIVGGIFLAIFLTYRQETRHIQAFQAYRQGENATTAADREQFFNQSLQLYQQLADDYASPIGSGHLYYNLANSYFQLGAYPEAILNYYRALKADPGNDEAWSNLQVALNKLNLPTQPARSFWQKILQPNLGMSIAQRFQLFFALAVATLLMGSVYIWKEISSLKRASQIATLGALLVLLSIFFSYYLEPVEAVVLKASTLYKDAGTQYAKVQEDPLPAGSKVEVLDVLQEGKWVKVYTSNEVIGFIPVERLDII